MFPGPQPIDMWDRLPGPTMASEPPQSTFIVQPRRLWRIPSASRLVRSRGQARPGPGPDNVSRSHPDPIRLRGTEPDDDDDDSGIPFGHERLHFGETPLTDPRALGSSALLHVLLIVLASLTVLNVAITRVPEVTAAMRGELDPVDNRADKGEGPGSGWGISGRDRGGSHAFVAPAAGAPSGAGLDPAADALLNEILPSTAQQQPEALQRALPGPQTTGVGLIPGSGMGGGGGSGGGSGGGIGRGIGPGTEFFGARENGRSFAYVIDCSGSMASRNSLEVAKRELLSSLNQLPPTPGFR